MIKRIQIVGMLLGAILLTSCGNDKPKEFMTQKEKEAVEELSRASEEESKARDEYVESHKVDLVGQYPLEMFEEFDYLYDIVDELGVPDSMENLYYIYEQASYDELEGRLSFSIWAGENVQYSEKVSEARWEYSGSKNSKFEKMLEEWITDFEDRYGEYTRRTFEHDELLKTYPGVQYVWNLERNPELDRVEIDYVDMGSKCTLKIEKYFADHEYADVEKDLFAEMVKEEIYLSPEESEYYGNNPSQYIEKIRYADFAYRGDLDVSRLWNGTFVGVDGTRITFDVFDISYEYGLGFSCSIDIEDSEYSDTVHCNFKSYFLEPLCITVQTQSGTSAPNRIDVPYGEMSIDSLFLRMYLSDDLNKLYVYQTGYGVRNYIGIYQREVPTDATWFYEFGKEIFERYTSNDYYEEDYQNDTTPETNYYEYGEFGDVDTLELAGSYAGSYCVLGVNISIYTSPEDEVLGKVTIYFTSDFLDTSIGGYLTEDSDGIYTLDGEIVKTGYNRYTIKDKLIDISISYFDEKEGFLAIDIIMDQVVIDQCSRIDHFVS